MAVSFLSVACAAVAAPLNPAYRTSEYEFYLTDLKARVLITQPELDSPVVQVARSLNIPVIALPSIYEYTEQTESGTLSNLSVPTAYDLALILHMSGTTSRLKIVPLTQRNLWASTFNVSHNLGLLPDDRCLNIMPLFHIHGLVGVLLASLYAGASVICTAGFNALYVIEWLTATQATWYSAMPTMHQKYTRPANGRMSADMIMPGHGDSHLRTSKIGFHIRSRAVPNEFIPILQRINNANKPLAALTIVNHRDLVQTAKSVSNRTFIVYRPVLWDDSNNPETNDWISGKDWFARLKPSIDGVPADAFQIINEWFVLPTRTPQEMQRFGQFYKELMDECTRHGVKCTIGDIAVGNLEPQHEDALAPMFKQAQRQGHYFNYHAYCGQSDNYNMTVDADLYAMWWKRWARRYPRLKFVFGEAGSFGPSCFRDTNTTLTMMNQLDELVDSHAAQVMGACWWTLGAIADPQFEADDFHSALLAIEQNLLRHS